MSKAIPDVRFEGFEKEWESVIFKDFLDSKEGIRRGPFGSALRKEFFVPESDYVVYEQQNAIYDRYDTRYNISKEKYEELIKFEVSPGDFIMSGAGTIGRVSRVPHNVNKGIFNQALIRFKINFDKTDSEYFLQFLRSDLMQQKLTSTNPGSAMSNLVPMSEVKQWSFFKPSLEEQRKIGFIFKQLDDTIALQQQLVKQHQQYKKAMLQKMFPQKGERVPKIRFEGCIGDWEIRKFKDFISKAGKKNSSGKDYISYSVSNKLGLVKQGEQFEGSRLDNLDKTAYKIVNPNEFAYNPARINVGSIGFNNLGSTVIVSSLYVVLKMSDKINNEYILQFIKSTNFNKEVKKNTEGSVREYLFYENFKNIKFPYTSDYKEQQKIGSFFKQLDDTIALHQKKLEDYQQLKKALLKRMFV